MTTSQPRVLSVAKSAAHSFSKLPTTSITLLKGVGVEGDCHAGTTVQHQALSTVSPAQENLRQVHLLPVECLREVSAKLPQPLSAGTIGENVTTEGIDLLALPSRTELHFIDAQDPDNKAIIVLTGLRDPGPRFDKYKPGLKEKFLVRDGSQRVVKRLAGVMGTVKQGGLIKPGMGIKVVRPAQSVPLSVV